MLICLVMDGENTNSKKIAEIMKLKLFLMLAAMMLCMGVSAKKYPEIKFEKTTIDLGTFCMDEPVRKCVFKFTNVGKSKLVINYVHTSCGCTVAEYTKDFIAPGATGEITVTYDGTGKVPSKFKKSIQVFTNCKNELARIFIYGEMTDVPVTKKVEKEE